MSSQEPIEIDSVNLVPDFTDASTDAIVWVPDELEIKMQQKNDVGERVQSHYSYACLEHLFLVLDQIGNDESGDVLFGTGSIEVTFLDDKVILQHTVDIVGTPDEIQSEIENLIYQTLKELYCRGVDTQAVVEGIATGRFAPWTVSPLTTHDRVLDEY